MPPPGSKLPHQISWRVDSVETLQMYHHRFKAEGVPVQQEVTHGIQNVSVHSRPAR
jgi:hypothetical protein